MMLHGGDLERVTTFLLDRYKITYQLLTPASAVLAFEEYFFRNGSMQFNTFNLVKTAEGIRIDAIGGGGSSGMFTFSWGSEKEFSTIAYNRLSDWAAENGLELEELETVKI